MSEWWFPDFSAWENVKIIAWRFKRMLTNHNNAASGCVCGAYAPDKFVWFTSRAFRQWWDHHVEYECPLPRDEDGNVLNL